MTYLYQALSQQVDDWRIANDLRGSVDGWNFKTYVLGRLFYRFISENLTANLNETLSHIFVDIEGSGSESEYDFMGLFDDLDVNRNKLGATVAKCNGKLGKLLNVSIAELEEEAG